MPPTIHDRIGQSRAGAPALVVLALAVVAVWWLSGQVARESYRNILIAVVLFQTLWVFFRWRASIYAFMVYVIVEGFLVNYFYNVPELNLMKDVYVASLFAVLTVTTVPRGIFPVPRTAWILPFALFGIVYTAQIFNPYLPNILVGLVGLRVSLLYALLAPVGYWFFDSRERVIRFFVFMTLISIPVAAFGIFQYFAGPGWLISLSPGFARAVYYASGAGTAGGYYFRTISTFVQTGGFAIYLCLMMLVAVAQISMTSLRKQRWWIIGAFGMQFLAALTTGGRAPLVMFFAALALLMTMQGRLARVLPIVAVLAVLFIGAVIVLGPVVAERFATLLDLQGVQARNVPLMVGWLYEAMQTDPAGMGAGYATVASRHAGVTPLNAGPVENTFARIRFETGLPGLILYVIFILVLVRECIRVPQRTKDRELSWLVSACAAFLLVNIFLSLPWGTPFDTSPTNVFLWFFLGFLARAPLLTVEKSETEMATVEIAGPRLSKPGVSIPAGPPQ
ncbi:MAG: hypothetical protein M1451_00575 [Acidobacteria bacterium]|nr:hypothetical protein [Acidobacteriota bacterium]